MTDQEPIRPASDAEIARALVFVRLPEWARRGIKARIEADAATIREQAEALRINESARNDYLRAQNAAQAEEIERIKERAVRVHLELEHKHAAENAELRARCETLETEITLLLEACGDMGLKRAIRARREAEKQ